MITSFPVLYLINQTMQIYKAIVPDLNLVFDFQREQGQIDFSNVIKQRILAAIQAKQIRINKPRSLKFYNNFSLNLPHGHQHLWSSVLIPHNTSDKWNIFKKGLPGIGLASNIISGFCFAINTFVSARLTSGGESSAMALNVIGSIIWLFIYIMIYLKSGTSETLAKIGATIDQRFCNSKEVAIFDADEVNIAIADSDADISSSHFFTLVANTSLVKPTSSSISQPSTTLILTGLGMTTLLLANAIMSGITVYQETVALGDRSVENELTFWDTKKAETLGIITVITNTIGSLAFQGNFGKEAVISFNKWWSRRGAIQNREDLNITSDQIKSQRSYSPSHRGSDEHATLLSEHKNGGKSLTINRS